MGSLQSFKVLSVTGGSDNEIVVMLCGRGVGTSNSRIQTGIRRTIRDVGESAIYIAGTLIELAMEATSVRPTTARDGQPSSKFRKSFLVDSARWNLTVNGGSYYRLAFLVSIYIASIKRYLRLPTALAESH